MHNVKNIYKICSKEEWEKALSNGIFRGTAVDKNDKYIHFSTKPQLKETLKLHFNRKNDLYLIEVSCKELNIKWEKSRKGDLFPHLYDTLNISHVLSVNTLLLDDKGNHILPSLN